MNLRRGLTILATAVAGSLVGAYFAGAFGTQTGVPAGANADSPAVHSDAGLRIMSSSLNDLVRSSSMIIQGTLIDRTSVPVSVPGVDGTIGMTREDVVSTFKIENVFSGDVSGDTIEVVQTVSNNTSAIGGLPAFTVSEPAVEWLQGHTYVLFLNQYPDYGGRTIIGLASDPGSAELSGESLHFLASPGLLADVAAAGSPQITAAFAGIELPALRAAISAAQPRDKRPS